MVIASDFETRSYASLAMRFGRQFLLFIIGTLLASGIMYGIEKNYSNEIEYRQWNYEEWRHREMEYFLNTTGRRTFDEFTQTHKVDKGTTRDFLHLLHKIALKGIDNDTYEGESYWENYHTAGMTFLQAFALVISTITTIGWGHVTPMTTGGKAFTCVIAILGIPLTLLMIVSGSQLMIRVSKWIVRKIFDPTRMNLLYKPFLAIIIFVYIVTMAAVIAKIEYFDYSDAVWYSIMAFTTVGFGDVVHASHLYHGRESSAVGVTIFQLLWLVFGFIFIGALVLAFVYDNWGDGRHTQFHQIFRQKDEELVENENND